MSFLFHLKGRTFTSVITYKVFFEYGNAITAEVVNLSLYKDIVRFTTINGTPSIDWYLVYADDEKMAIDIANKVVKLIWGKYLA